MYATYANEYLGCYDKMVESFRLVLEIFKKHHLKFVQASIIKPDLLHQQGLYMPARVHPTTLETITDEWGHHRLDVFGLFMYKLGDLVKKGFGCRFSTEDYYRMGHIRNYIFNMGFEADFGIWEEGPEEHSSSYGAVLGGLTMWFDQGHYDFKYRQKIPISHLVPVCERMIAEGYGALVRLLPRESATRACDLAQLSLIWPYNIVRSKSSRRRATVPAADEVLDVIKRSKQGLKFVDIQAKTGFVDKKIRNIIFRLNKLGKIKRHSRGVYVAL